MLIENAVLNSKIKRKAIKKNTNYYDRQHITHIEHTTHRILIDR